MIVAVASGKGGTGKTTLAVNLAAAAAMGGETSRPVSLLDCDVEEPNAHLFLAPEIGDRTEILQPVPRVVEDRCNHCGTCAEVCEFHAIASLPEQTIIFEELCHGCGACARFCPRNAIEESDRRIGVVEHGTALGGRLQFGRGILEIGRPSAVPLIRALRARAPREGLTFLDAPPGTTCPVVETLRDTDLALLVTEPTPFGLHDLDLAADLVLQLECPAAVVINRSDGCDEEVLAYAESKGLPVLAGIPFDRRYAETLARGGMLVAECAAYLEWMQRLLASIPAAAAREVPRAEATT